MPDELPPPSARERSNKYRRTELRTITEQWCPYLVALSTGVVMYSFSTINADQHSQYITDVLPTAVTIAAVFAGFQMTAPAILVSVNGSSSIQQLKKRGSYDLMVKYIAEAVSWTIVFIIFASFLIGHNAFRTDPILESTFVVSFTTALFVLMIGASIRIVWFMTRLLKVQIDIP